MLTDTAAATTAPTEAMTTAAADDTDTAISQGKAPRMKAGLPTRSTLSGIRGAGNGGAEQGGLLFTTARRFVRACVSEEAA
jgi:hypothetical protein